MATDYERHGVHPRTLVESDSQCTRQGNFRTANHSGDWPAFTSYYAVLAPLPDQVGPVLTRNWYREGGSHITVLWSHGAEITHYTLTELHWNANDEVTKYRLPGRGHESTPTGQGSKHWKQIDGRAKADIHSSMATHRN